MWAFALRDLIDGNVQEKFSPKSYEKMLHDLWDLDDVFRGLVYRNGLVYPNNTNSCEYMLIQIIMSWRFD